MGTQAGRFTTRSSCAISLAITLCLTAELPALGQQPAEHPGIDSTALLQRAFHNLYGDDYVQTMTLSTRSHGGRAMTRSLQITRKQSTDPGKALVRFTDPQQIRRTSILILENRGASDDLYVYLPALRRTKHLSSSQRADSFFGTDFSYEDVEPKRAEEYDPKWVGFGTHGDKPCALIEIRAREGIESAYDKMVSCIEAERAIILWTDFYAHGAIVKRLEIDLRDVRVIADRFIPFSLTMTTARNNSQTLSVTQRYELRADIPEELFSTWNLEAGDARRDRSRSASEADAKILPSPIEAPKASSKEPL